MAHNVNLLRCRCCAEGREGHTSRTYHGLVDWIHRTGIKWRDSETGISEEEFVKYLESAFQRSKGKKYILPLDGPFKGRWLERGANGIYREVHKE